MQREAWEQIGARKLFVEKLMTSCVLCPRSCGVNRFAGQVGFCGLDGCARCFREMLHPHEERELSPSHQVYFSGCNLRCTYCSVAEWNELPMEVEEAIALDDLARRVAERRKHGARNLNLLGGEPAVNLYGILDLLERIDWRTTVVWNSNMYYSAPVTEALEGLVDIFLADVKSGSAECGRDLLGASDYFSVAGQRVKEAARQTEVIVRHLVLPGHLECCCFPVLEWLAAALPEIKVSLRWDYMPPADGRPGPAGYLTQAEKECVLERAAGLGLNLIS